ncbi:DUF3429 domain-containing protein [Jannaschia sp. CCS1]|uniref:DUF3429 domain-containing protein n=1 Tax=Jannaschia sp. (strain CCS1) TaxID=290400 RepID=UPI000053A001|nr:DUF3429 domain-containing protein [Jannaschia sp. CCS1]ABD53421.1 hypothetical protein Jann_0504 [Jannaschia sp. CCS1]
MIRIPSSALLLGLAGLIPFLWGASSSASLLLDYMPVSLPAAFTGASILTAYGTIILSFMAGVIWGFAAKAGGPWMPLGLALSTVPALWIFFFTGQPHSTQLVVLGAGFIGLLALDVACVRKGLAPGWWLALRLLLTGVVVFCLLIGFLLIP